MRADPSRWRDIVVQWILPAIGAVALAWTLGYVQNHAFFGHAQTLRQALVFLVSHGRARLALALLLGPLELFLAPYVCYRTASIASRRLTDTNHDYWSEVDFAPLNWLTAGSLGSICLIISAWHWLFLVSVIAVIIGVVFAVTSTAS